MARNNVVIKSHPSCLFCMKIVSGSSVPAASKDTFAKFSNLICQRPGSEDGGELPGGRNSVVSTVCNDCHFAVQGYVKSAEEIEVLKSQMLTKVEQLYLVMKSAAMIPSRIMQFQEGLEDPSRAVNERKEIYRACKATVRNSRKKECDSVPCTDLGMSAMNQETSKPAAEVPLLGEVSKKISHEGAENVVQMEESPVFSPKTNVSPNQSFQCLHCHSMFSLKQDLIAHAKELHNLELVRETIDHIIQDGNQGQSDTNDLSTMDTSSSDTGRLSQSSSESGRLPTKPRKRLPCQLRAFQALAKHKYAVVCGICGQSFTAQFKYQSRAKLIEHLRSVCLPRQGNFSSYCQECAFANLN